MNREKQKLATRQKIIDTAIVLFRAHGYDAVTTRQIAKEAGVAAGTVFSHFADKHQLTKAIFHQQITSLISGEPKGNNSPESGLTYFSSQTANLYQYYGRDRALSEAFLKNAFFEQAFFSEQLEGFVDDVADRLATECPSLEKPQRRTIATAWMGYYFFHLLQGLGGNQPSTEWHGKLMKQCNDLLELVSDKSALP
ncbi:hypothetical protein CS022_23190 [Veronia nyctiphanis]|uniref:HTH tetR-type domain-containing protein n=1 Tax=Veronia nyctiphanis TaxID=1278244 RepID=A0A4Q0YIB3_9GAMM|nr:TetR/AcrR family transcriptional regulator [Veronia nyctiphanis]RXJ70447.1 hypothetical protein CS022_23190 [Veronia nyctiphanis]